MFGFLVSPNNRAAEASLFLLTDSSIEGEMTTLFFSCPFTNVRLGVFGAERLVRQVIIATFAHCCGKTPDTADTQARKGLFGFTVLRV